MSAWGKESIQALLDRNNAAVIRAVRALAARQTAAELATHHTSQVNGRGFNKHDAPFLTDILLQINRGRTLSPKQMAVARNKVKHYWRQLAEIANAAGVPVPSTDTLGEYHHVALDAQVARQGKQQVEARLDELAALECTCENYDGEKQCPSCTKRFGYRETAGSW